MGSFGKIWLLAIMLFAPGVYGQGKKPVTLRPPRARLNAVDRLSKMPPQQRQRELEKLPPERRAKLEERLEKYDKLPPAQKERLRAQTEVFQNLPPDRQEAVRKSFRRFNTLPEDRRLPVRDELRRLRKMPENERNARMESDDFRNKYSPGEQQILQNLASLVPPPY